jgi:hypothetical protein
MLVFYIIFSKKQDIVSNYTAEAEYRVLATTTTKLIWFMHLLRKY